MRISTKLIASVLLIFVLAFGALAWIVDRIASRSLLEQATAELEALRASRGQFVESYFQRQRGAVQLAADTIVTRQALRDLSRAAPADRERVQALYEGPALNWMKVFRWDDVLLVDAAGAVIFSARARVPFGTDLQRGFPPSLTDAFRRARSLDASEPGAFVDFARYEPADGALAAFGAAPVAAAPPDQDTLLGVLLIEVSPGELDDMMTDRTGLKNTGETYLIGPRLRMRTESRFPSRAVRMETVIDTEAARRAIAGETGTIEQKDYRGDPVLASFAPLDRRGVRWGLIAEMDLDEVLAPARVLRIRILQVLVAALVTGGLLLVVVLRRVVLRPVERLASAASSAEEGNLDQPIEVTSTDEIGQLQRTFAKMIRAIRASRLDLETKYDELRRLESLRDSLTHMIVHDLRSPVTSVMGYLDLLRLEGHFLRPEAQSIIHEAYDGASDMSEMIGSLLDVSRLESGEMPLDRRQNELPGIVARAVRSIGGLATRRRIALSWPDGPLQASCDAHLIQRVIVNLLGNALKFTPPSGSISLTVRLAAGRPRIEVSDTGPGIPPEFLPRVFDKFTQAAAGVERKQHSSGLGLAFCKLAVEAHGGTIGVSSRPGGGSTFWFELPASAAAAVAV
jgi:signal transduction histidine kinase